MNWKRILNPLKWKLPFQLLLIIVGVLFFGEAIPLSIKQFCYTISFNLKQLLILFLPIIIFSYLAGCILSFKKGVFTFIALLLAIVYCSNFLATLIAYCFGKPAFAFLQNSLSGASGGDTDRILAELWALPLPSWIDHKHTLFITLFLGLSIGVVFSLYRVALVEKFVNGLKSLSDLFLGQIFIPLVPIFILGLIIQLEHEGMLEAIINSYGFVFVFSFAVELIYIIFLFLLVAKFNVSRAWEYMRNTLPAAITGFSSMSSAASMPLTLQAAERNTGKPNIARVVIPSTVNIHMIGNCMTIAFLAFAFLGTMHMPFPEFGPFLMLGLSMAFAQFSVAAVPGGGILVMLGFLKSYLGFTDTMCATLVTIYILFDLIITTVNILGNSVLVIAFAKVFALFGIQTGAESSDKSSGKY